MTPARQPLVLLIESRDNLYEIFSDFLAEAGFAVDGASTVAEALEKSHRLQPDVIVADVEAADLRGRTTIDGVRRMRETRHIPIVALRGASDTVPRELGDVVLCKPCSAEQLLGAIQSQLLAPRQAPRPDSRE